MLVIGILVEICHINNLFTSKLSMEANVSHFAKHINFPICHFNDQMAAWPACPNKEPISFLSGDPTLYGQTQFQMPQRGYEILRQSILNENNHGYCGSTGIPEFRKAVKNLYKPKFQLDISNVFINHGVNMGLLGCLLALTNQGEQILVPQLGYPFYKDVCPAMKRVAVPYRLVKERNFEIDLQHLATLVNEKTAFIYIINPTNPMGTVFSRQHMAQILKFSDQHQIPIVVDEVYFRQVYPGVDYLSFGELTEDVPVVVLSGVEKIMSVPGWVQSWTIIFDKHRILDQIKKNMEVIATIFLHTNTFTQHALPKIFSEIGIFTAQKMDIIHNNYKLITQKLENLHGLKTLPAQATIYLTVQIQLQKFKHISTDIDFVKKLRLQENVNVLPISIMGTGCNGFRLLTCALTPLYDSFFERLSNFVERHKKQ